MRYLFLLLLALTIASPQFAQTHKPITADVFLNQPFGFEESIVKLTVFSGIKFKVKKEPVTNVHNPNVTDTIYQLKKCKNLILFYKADGNAFVYKTTLRSKKAKLAGGIHPGMSREDFYASIKGLKDDGQKVHTFYSSDKNATGKVTFKGNKVKEIDLEYNVD